MQASLVYGRYRIALWTEPKTSRYEAMLALLDATESALAIVEDPSARLMPGFIPDAVAMEGYYADVELLEASARYFAKQR